MNATDLEAIAEEMEKSDPFPGPGGWADRIRAWIEANKESPQRRAFVEAAEAHFKGESNYAVALAAYRALVESERGEGKL